MIYLTNDIINNQSIFNDLITNEKQYINSIEKIQNKQKDTILNYIQKFGNDNEDITQDSTDKIKGFLNSLKDFLNTANNSLLLINDMQNDLSIIETNFQEVDIDKFNKKNSYTTSIVLAQIAEIENFLNDILINFFEFTPSISENKNEEKNVIEDNSNYDDISTNTDIVPENTLIISESKGYVYLPYTEEQLIQLSLNNPGLSRFKLINKYFRKNYNQYKNSAISRFRETFNLIRNKEKGSILQAFDLSFELFFKYNLHPAIIAACRNSNELDVYLGCLENGKIDDFKYFNIIFNVAPMISKKQY